MRALVFEGPGLIAVSELPEPKVIDPGDAIVRVTRAGLCGSDLHPYLGREPMARGTVPGHEAVGVIETVGSDVSGLHPGQRVIVPFSTSCGNCDPCRRGVSARCDRGALLGWRDPSSPTVGLDGCQAELVRIPLADSTLVAAPDLDDHAALLLADNLPTAFAALDRARPSGSLTVVGAGAVGLCAIALARRFGVEQVVAIEPVAERAAKAAELGAAVREPGASPPTTAVIEASGSPGAQRVAYDSAAAGAVVSIISVQTGSEFPFSPTEAYDRNLTVAWGRAPVRSILDSHLGVLTEIAVDVADLIVARSDVALSEGPIAYAAFAERAFVKAAFDPAR
jgi:threonine dehydrogenase-like Zn-dependent dehydrogenase